MVPSIATFTIIQKATGQAKAAEGGGLEKKLNDMRGYAQLAGTSGASFALSHIPLVGPILAKAFDLAASFGISELYKKLTKESTSNQERIINSLHLMENALAKSMRQAYHTADFYANKDKLDCKDCQDAFRESYAVGLLADCVTELDAAQEILDLLSTALIAERSRLKALSQRRSDNLRNDIDNFREEHKNGSCMGTQTCYRVNVPSVFNRMQNSDL